MKHGYVRSNVMRLAENIWGRGRWRVTKRAFHLAQNVDDNLITAPNKTKSYFLIKTKFNTSGGIIKNQQRTCIKVWTVCVSALGTAPALPICSGGRSFRDVLPSSTYKVLLTLSVIPLACIDGCFIVV